MFRSALKTNQIYDLHVDLIKLRHEDARFREQIVGGVDGAVLGARSFVFRYFSDGNDDRLLLVNLGKPQLLKPMPEPLLAAPPGFEWATLWSSDSEQYGGPGENQVANQNDSWVLPGEATVALRLVPRENSAPAAKVAR